jgi:hypothetical protein
LPADPWKRSVAWEKAHRGDARHDTLARWGAVLILAFIALWIIFNLAAFQ